MAEEFSIRLDENSIVYSVTVPAMHDPKVLAYFMVAKIKQKDVDDIVFGTEGQGWRLMSIEEFMRCNEVVEPLKSRLQGYLDNLV